jgi:hypothetical protein
VSEDMFALVENTKIISGYRTDHSAIVFFCFSASLAKRGKGYCKFNSQLLRDSEYSNLVKTWIKNTISEYYSNGDVDDIINVELSCNDQNFFCNT